MRGGRGDDLYFFDKQESGYEITKVPTTIIKRKKNAKPTAQPNTEKWFRLVS